MPSNWDMEILEYGTTASRIELEAPGTDMSHPRACFATPIKSFHMRFLFEIGEIEPWGIQKEMKYKGKGMGMYVYACLL